MAERKISFYRGQSSSQQPQGWAEFVKQVKAGAARRRKRHKAPTGKPLPKSGKVEQLWNNPRYEEGRCKHVNTKTKAQCKKWAMHGATRCNFHGGYRENPTHKGTIALFETGAIDRHDEHRRAMTHVYKRGREVEREQAKQALRQRNLGCHAPDVLQGMDAYIIEDNGRAWRRWIKTLDQRQADSATKRSNGKGEI